MVRHDIKVAEVLDDFLYSRIQRDPDFRRYLESGTVPDYITDNLNKTKKLRPYQEQAVKAFIWLWQRDQSAANHLLFNMATGTGKTLVMACCILFLYEQGYRNFIFIVSRVNILEQAERNLTDFKFSKYLFNDGGVRFHGKRVNIGSGNTVIDDSSQDINIIFTSTQKLANLLANPRENELSAEDFENHRIAMLADEAHHLNVSTKRKLNHDEQSDNNDWESAIIDAINVNPHNVLLEFTATVDLKNDSIRQKYLDKIVCRYDFLQFNMDGYSKDVKFLYNEETQIENQKRLLIVNAVALSEYRRLLAERTMRIAIKPVVLVKSTKIKQSIEDRQFFDNVISTLNADDFRFLDGRANGGHDGDQYEILRDMFRWINSRDSGLVDDRASWEHNPGLTNFIGCIKNSFAHENGIIYNSQKKERAEALSNLDGPRNNIRVIFSVAALNEGWDVLSLFDIIHFDISENKKVSLQDIQLIGRGARYCPYKLPRNYRPDNGNTLINRNLNFDEYRRKFDNDPDDKARALETFVYHFIKTGMFMDNLRKDLLDEGVINNGVEKRTIHMKKQFMASQTYQKGFVLINECERRKATTEDEIERVFNKTIKAINYEIRSSSLSDKEENNYIASRKRVNIRLNEDYFARPIILKALMKAENGFFYFDNLSRHIVGLTSIDELIDEYLPKYEITYEYDTGKEIDSLEPSAKLRLLIDSILPDVRKRIELGMPYDIGTRIFRPHLLSDIFSTDKSIYLASFPVKDPTTGEKIYINNDERGRSQTLNENYKLRYDVAGASWYAYDENYGTNEEKSFVKWMAGRIPELQRRYPGCEIYLIRNELEYYLFSTINGRRYMPDYLLIINDTQRHEMYYQCIIEPKGGHIWQQDEWKQQSLSDLTNSQIDIASASSSLKEVIDLENDGYQEIKNIGFRFYNSGDNDRPERLTDFVNEFDNKLGLDNNADIIS